VNPQVPLEQDGAAFATVVVHGWHVAPQCCTELLVSRHTPLQSVSGALHATPHVPLLHVA
jgi:hypothetical protein